MVLINLKSTMGADSNNDSFLFETKSTTTVDDLIQSLVDIHNARQRSFLIINSVKDLAMYGPMKNPESIGTDKNQELLDEYVEIERGTSCVSDPSGRRLGNPPDSQFADLLKREVESLEAYIDKKQVQNKIALTIDGIEEKINSVRGAVAMTYPMGLPEWDLVRISLDDSIENIRTHLGQSIMDASKAALWTCNKEFRRGTLVSERIGSCNEKTKVIAKLTTKGAGPPPRESVISEAERSAMTAFYFRRQEELKRLAQVDEDDYLNSEWADPKGMKRNLQGLNDLKTSSLRF